MRVDKYPLKWWKAVLYWRLLRKSRIFIEWYEDFLGTLLFDLQKYDIDGESVFKKYHKKYEWLSRQKSGRRKND